MAGWETKFEGSTERALRGARLVTEFAEECGLQRTDDRQKSVIWGTPARDMLWCFPDHATKGRGGGSRTGLELFLRHVPDEVAAQLRARLAATFDAPQASDPKIAWGTVVERWDELRTQVLEPYVDALQRS